MADSMWEQEGRLVKVKYYPLEPKIPLDSFAKDIFNMRIKQGPINSSYRVNQGYLFRFNKEGLVKIMKSVPRVRWPEFVDVFINQIDSHNEDIEFIGDIEVRNMLKKFTSFIRNRGFSYPDLLIENFYLSLKTKPFVILAGVSGTGKTKLVKLFAEAVGASTDNGQFTLIPVRPDWSDPSDLIGYKDLSGVFRPGPLTQVLVEAAQPHNRDKPFFVCLDEMNLARVEHYFSDLLSILETQQWSGDRIVTDPVIRRETLDTEDDRDRYGELYLPDNVYIIGTVNMDETTHPFSKKVLVVSRQVV
jgi:energy-coupling factor transporter ATP-binding protein EcfA2